MWGERSFHFQKSASRDVRTVTSSALEVLVSAEDVIRSESGSFASPRHGWAQPEQEEFILPKPQRPMEDTSDEEEELHLSFPEFERLYKEGYITREQIRTGRVRKRDLETIKSVLASESWSSSKSGASEDSLDEDEMLLDCGLKRVDSKRYKRDYVVNRSPQVSRKRWEVQPSSSRPMSSEVVKATPAGERETVSLDQAEDKVGEKRGKMHCCTGLMLATFTVIVLL